MEFGLIQNKLATLNNKHKKGSFITLFYIINENLCEKPLNGVFFLYLKL